MTFPFTMTDSFRIATTADIAVTQELLEVALLEWLDSIGARDVTISDHHIEFNARLIPWGPSLHHLNFSGRGEIQLTVHKKEIVLDYRFQFTKILVAVTALVGLLFGPVLLTAPNLTAIEATILLALMWGFYFGGNYLLSSIHLPKALQELARQSTGGLIY